MILALLDYQRRTGHNAVYDGIWNHSADALEGVGFYFILAFTVNIAN